MMGSSFDERAATIQRRLLRNSLDAVGRSFWDNWKDEDASFLVGMSLSAVLLMLEPALWYDDWPKSVLRFRVSDPVALWLLPLLPLNGFLLDRFLSSKTPDETALPWWLRGVRFAGASVPILGLYMIWAWKSFLGRRRPRPQRGSFDLFQQRPSLPDGLRWREFYRSGVFFFWLACGLLPVLAWALWLATTPGLGARRHAILLGLCVLLHPLAYAFMARHFWWRLQRSRATGWRKAWHRAAPVLWLCGVPGIGIGTILTMALAPPLEPLVWHAYANRTGASRILLWRQLQGSLRQRWQGLPWFLQWRRPPGLVRKQAAAPSEEEVTAYYRLRTLLLVLEGAAFSAAISFPEDLSDSVAYCALALAGAGLLVQSTRIAGTLLRVSSLSETLRRHPYGRYLLLTQAGFLVGLKGPAIVEGAPIEQAGYLIALVGVLCSVLTFFFFLPLGGSPNPRDAFLWMALFLSLGLLGLPIGLGGDWSRRILGFSKVLLVISPLLNAGLFLAFGRWLLRPFSWRDVFNHSLPLRLRTALAFVTLTAVLPLGGLAIPFWIYARHRVWPRYERRLQLGVSAGRARA